MQLKYGTCPVIILNEAKNILTRGCTILYNTVTVPSVLIHLAYY